MAIKTARRSFEGPWPCQKPWPEDCFVQCGGDGLVLPAGSLKAALTKTKEGEKVLGEALGVIPPREGAYLTAFFEAFPSKPKTFIRGEGKTIEEAEASAWNQYQKFLNCRGHRFHRRGYRNGAGFCRRCGMFKSKVFKILDRCRYSDKRPAYSFDKKNKGYCRRHNNKNPDRLGDIVNGKFQLRRQ